MTDVRRRLLDGLLIPAHPLALNRQRKLDERRQRALTRYYVSAGAGGVAVGVHTTQFAIHDPKVGLLQPVLALASDVIGPSPILKIAGVCGLLKQAVGETELAASLRYDAVLLSFSALRDATIPELIQQAQAVSEILPIVGFYLQPRVGGCFLSYDFWRRFLEIENVVGIKVAPFNRYQTIDVVRAIAASGRAKEVALYTGNDDNIVNDLLTVYDFEGQRLRFNGGLLGHWAVWTERAREYFERARQSSNQPCIDSELLTIGTRITDANAALFDAANGFRGCIAGLHEILRRQELLEGRWCLDPNEDLSPGQEDQIDRVCRLYPSLQDDNFVRAHLDEWLK